MIQFTDYINPLAFFIALFVGLLINYLYSKPKKIILQWPTPENSGKIVYNESDAKCYTYSANEVSCS